MIAGFQQEQSLAAIFLIINRGAVVLYPSKQTGQASLTTDSPKGVLLKT
jgi:hypothetical protein